MDCDTARIIQVSLSKITDSRRRRGGPALRRNLLVSQVLNSVLTSSDSAYCTYRTKVEIDMDIDAMENEALPFDKAKMTVDTSGGPVEAGNTAHTMRSAVKSNERVTEMESCAHPGNSRTKTVGSMEQRDSVNEFSEHSTGKNTKVKSVTGSKRPRSAYGNEPCDNHAVHNKRYKFESEGDGLLTDLNNHEPMDVSGLVSVFSTSFTGLCNISRNASTIGSKLDSFQFLNPVQPVACVLSWPQTVVEAF